MINNDGNQSLWRTLKCDGDGTWIGRGLLSGTILVAHDGSYMKEVAADVCSAAVMIYCTRTQQTCTCTIVEQSPSAGSYRGEILGAILAQLLLRAASVGIFGPFPVLSEDCDNNGVVLHGNSFSKPLPTSQTQADPADLPCTGIEQSGDPRQRQANTTDSGRRTIWRGPTVRRAGVSGNGHTRGRLWWRVFSPQHLPATRLLEC